MANESTEFTIGGQKIAVPALTLYHLELCKEELDKLQPETNWIEYSSNIVTIVAKVTSEENWQMRRAELVKICSVGEMRELPESMNNLLRISGFQMGEAEAGAEATDGTGMSMLSPPNSPSTESVAATQVS